MDDVLVFSDFVNEIEVFEKVEIFVEDKQVEKNGVDELNVVIEVQVFLKVY